MEQKKCKVTVHTIDTSPNLSRRREYYGRPEVIIHETLRRTEVQGSKAKWIDQVFGTVEMPHVEEGRDRRMINRGVDIVKGL